MKNIGGMIMVIPARYKNRADGTATVTQHTTTAHYDRKYEVRSRAALTTANLPLAAQVCLPLTKATYCVSALMKTVDVSCEAREVGQSLYTFGLAGLPEQGAPDTGSYCKKKE